MRQRIGRRLTALVVTVMTLGLINPGTALGTGTHSDTWSVNACSYERAHVDSGSTTHSHTTDENGNCGTIRTRLRYVTPNDTLGWTSWSLGDVTQVTAETAAQNAVVRSEHRAWDNVTSTDSGVSTLF